MSILDVISFYCMAVVDFETPTNSFNAVLYVYKNHILVEWALGFGLPVVPFLICTCPLRCKFTTQRYKVLLLSLGCVLLCGILVFELITFILWATCIFEHLILIPIPKAFFWVILLLTVIVIFIAIVFRRLQWNCLSAFVPRLFLTLFGPMWSRLLVFL